MKKILMFVAAFLFASIFVGCASSSSAIVVGSARPPTNPEDVKIYLSPPEKFEELALVSANNMFGSPFGEQAKVDTVINRMKKEAAKIGANGILLKSIGDQNVGSLNTTTGTVNVYGNTATGSSSGVSMAALLKTGSAIAIYVPSVK